MLVIVVYICIHVCMCVQVYMYYVYEFVCLCIVCTHVYIMHMIVKNPYNLRLLLRYINVIMLNFKSTYSLEKLLDGSLIFRTDIYFR